MPESIDWPRKPPSPHRGSRKFLFLVAFIAAIILSSKTALSYWVDLLWFRSLGYGEVFIRTLSLQWGIFAAFGLATFVILYGSFSLLKRAHLDDLPLDHTIFFGGREVNLSVKPVLRIVAIGGSLLIALATGAAMASEWTTLALFWFAPRDAGTVTDPIFHKPLGFFLFTLPAWNLIAGWLLSLAVITCLLAAFFILITGGARALGERRANYIPLPWRGLSITVAFLLLVLALRTYLGRFAQLFEHHTIFDGVTYTGAHVTLTGSLVVCAALLLGALIAAVGAMWAPRGRWLIAAIVPAAVCYAVVGLVSWYVSSFLVKPNELVREQPYIAYNIEMTRQGFRPRPLRRARISRRDNRRCGRSSQQPGHPAEHPPVGLARAAGHAAPDSGDPHLLRLSRHRYRSLQDQRHDARSDAWHARELNVEKLPVSSRNWINEKLIYTHGYGITMNP